MPNDLSISPISSVSSVSAASNFGRYATPDQTTAIAASTVAATPVAVTPSVTTPPIYPNPSPHVDTQANLVVMQFHNSQGDLVSQTPTQQQIQAYTTGASSSPAGGDVSSEVA